MDGPHLEQSKPLLLDDDSRRASHDSLDYVGQQPSAARRRRILFKLLVLAHPAHLTTICKRFGYACVPQLLRTRIWDDHAPPTKQFSTSYLNGLRGMTAVKVFTFHYLMAFTDFTYHPWQADERHDRIFLMPIIRYCYSGFTSQVFFGIAGYLTSLRLFQLLDKNEVNAQAKVLSSVAGSLFRRAFRLYLPVFCITFLTATYIYLGFYENNRPHIADRSLFPGPWNETKPARQISYHEQINYWRWELYSLTNIVMPDTYYPEHDQHLWSIHSEMRASLYLYGCIIGLATCTRYARLFFLFYLTYLFFIWNSWETWVYVLGAVVAQIDLIMTERAMASRQATAPKLLATDTEKDTEKQPQTAVNEGTMSTLARTSSVLNSSAITGFRFVLFLVAFYFLSFPIAGADFYAPGYETLKTFIPEWMERKDKMYPNIGTAILLLLLARSDPRNSKWRRMLMSSIPQYLGTISFAFYLIHGPILHVFGYMIPQRIWWAAGHQGADVGEAAWFGAICVGWSVSLLVSLCVADVWTREVEGRCVRLVKKMEKLAFKNA